jgi:hypothetical protein
MVIKIDISHPPSNIQQIIIKEIGIESKSNSNDDYKIDTDDKLDTNNSFADIVLDNEDDVNNVKQRLKDILIKNSIRDYVAVMDPEEQNKVVILKKEYAEEQLGLYHCPHCGIAFESQIHLSVHQRIHYFI